MNSCLSRAAALATLLLADRAGAADPAPARALPVAAVPLTWCSNALPVEAAGVLVRRDEVGLSFVAAGLVERVDVRAGEVVTQGQHLARLRLDEVEAQRDQARAALDKARRDDERSRQLLERAVIGREERQDAATRLQQAEAQLEAAEYARRFSVITAPAAGRILARLAEPHQLVAAGQPVLRFAADAGGWLLRASLNPAEADRLRPGDFATWQAGSDPTARTARVVRLAAGSDPVTRTIEVELEAEQVPPATRSGLLVHIQLQPAPVPPRPRIPAAALVEGEGSQAAIFLLSADGHTVERRTVVLEGLRGADAYLRTALPADRRVVVRGAEFLRDGSAVRVESAEAPAADRP